MIPKYSLQLPDVPNTEFVIVSHGAEERLVEEVPGHVLVGGEE